MTLRIFSSGNTPPLFLVNLVRSAGFSVDVAAVVPPPLPALPWHRAHACRYSRFPGVNSLGAELGVSHRASFGLVTWNAIAEAKLVAKQKRLKVSQFIFTSVPYPHIEKRSETGAKRRCSSPIVSEYSHPGPVGALISGTTRRFRRCSRARWSQDALPRQRNFV